MKIIEMLLAVFSIIFSALFIWHKLLNIKINFKSIKFYITLISLMLIALINYFNVNQYIRIAVVTLSLMLFFKFLFKENLQKCIITPIFSQMLTMVSEVIFATIIIFGFNLNSNDIANTQFGTLGANLIIAIISMIIVNIPFISKFYKIILKITDKIKSVYLIIFIFIITLISNILAMTVYY